MESAKKKVPEKTTRQWIEDFEVNVDPGDEDEEEYIEKRTALFKLYANSFIEKTRYFHDLEPDQRGVLNDFWFKIAFPPKDGDVVFVYKNEQMKDGITMGRLKFNRLIYEDHNEYGMSIEFLHMYDKISPPMGFDIDDYKNAKKQLKLFFLQCFVIVLCIIKIIF